MILKILQYPHKILRQKCQPVIRIDEKIRKLAEDMKETMISQAGVGLAASQIGELIQLIICQTNQGPLVLINPQVIGQKGKIMAQEGCFSFPNLFLPIKRAEEIEVKFLNLANEEINLKTNGLLARVIQHEIDHLNGILFIDRLPFWKKIFLRKK